MWACLLRSYAGWRWFAGSIWVETVLSSSLSSVHRHRAAASAPYMRGLSPLGRCVCRCWQAQGPGWMAFCSLFPSDSCPRPLRPSASFSIGFPAAALTGAQTLAASCLDSLLAFGFPPSSLPDVTLMTLSLSLLYAAQTCVLFPGSQPLQPTLLLTHPQNPPAVFPPSLLFLPNRLSPYLTVSLLWLYVHTISPWRMPPHLFSPFVILNGSLCIIFEKWGLVLLL